MQAPERFSDLPEYAFPRLRALLSGHAPGGPEIAMSIGEPRHPAPAFLGEVLAGALQGYGRYPDNNGIPALREAISGWLGRRFGASIDPDTQVMALNGTREGLFNAAMALLPETKNGARPVVLMPNPFYQVYAVAALACGAEPVYVPALAQNGFLPDYASLPPALLERCAALYVCSPSNPQGAVADKAYWTRLLDLAETYDFRIFADECYSEIYRDAPPTGALEAARTHAADPERVLVFHSLSKRSSLPGLRSGFVAGGPKAIGAIKQLRAYAGAPLPGPLQQAAAAVWADEAHVEDNRALYRAKYAVADEVFAGFDGYAPPQAGFFLWLPVPDGEAATLAIWKASGVKTLPGAYLSRAVGGVDPGAGYIRVALVAEETEVRQGLTAIRTCLEKLEG